MNVENIELFTHLAEIAGVFVGFGALISIRSEASRDEEVMMIRMIVVAGIMTVVAALTPVVINGYGVTGHGLWTASATVFLALWWGSSILDRWDIERTRVMATVTLRERLRIEIPGAPSWLSMNAALILILTGRFPDQEPALYTTAVAMNLLLTAGLLLYLVYVQRRPQSDRGVAPPDDASAGIRPPAPKASSQ
jgi:small-conductance mechanosensitive channel